jgi:hypothetical protein
MTESDPICDISWIEIPGSADHHRRQAAPRAVLVGTTRFCRKPVTRNDEAVGGSRPWTTRRPSVQRARGGRSHQYSFSGNAAQAQRHAQGLSRPNRRGGSDPCDPWRSALAGVRSDHAARLFGAVCPRTRSRRRPDPSTTSSITAAMPGTRSSISRGKSCPSRAARRSLNLGIIWR